MTFDSRQTMNMYAGVPASTKEKCCAPFNREPRRLTIFTLSQEHVLKGDVLKKIRAADDVYGNPYPSRREEQHFLNRVTLRIDILALPAGCGRGRQLMLPPEHFHIENL